MVVPGNKKCANIMTSGKKTHVICDSHLARTETRKRKKILKKTLLLLRFFDVQIRSN